MTNNAALARLQTLQNQIAAMRLTGAVSHARVKFATADKYSDDEIAATLSMMALMGLV